jgi:hypothetical protein
LYETLGNFSSTEGAVACGFLTTQNPKCRAANRQTITPKLPSDIARRWPLAVLTCNP